MSVVPGNSSPAAPTQESPLETPIQFVRGVGPKRAELLARLGLHTVEDVLCLLPRDILDLTDVCRVADLDKFAGPKEKRGVKKDRGSKAGAVPQTESVPTVRGRVVDLDGREFSDGKTLAAVLLNCDGDYLRGVWWNQGWVLQKFRPNDMVLFSGKPKRSAGRWEMSHPRIQWLDEDDTGAHGGVLVRYNLTEGLKMHEMRRIVRSVVEGYAELVPELLPDEFRAREQLPRIGEAIRSVHLPQSTEQYAAGKKRLIHQDLLEFQLGLAMRRRMWRQRCVAPRFPTTTKIDARIRRLLPFDLTAGQNKAIAEISADLDSGGAMHRLLQADVGAGKTVVAIYAMLVTIAAGHQAVLMAPTELLASQHWQTVDRYLAHSRVNRVLLTGQLSAAERKSALARIQSGELQLIVGTQAIIQKDVAFSKLGLVVIDEQHKFGVVQRSHFASSGTFPHTLVMTATPIPRSLCLTQFSDLDLSVIAELPPGRQKVTTSRLTTDAARARAWDFIRQKLLSGRQAYIICPRIETDAADVTVADDSSAEQVHRQLAAGELRDFTVGLVHGQLDPSGKAAAMEAFRAGRTQALVATSVVEVGVDVPNATLMLIQHAGSFGLSQLHQLRGRISRGKFQGYCFLSSDAENPEALTRLHALETYASGFDIAEADFRLRGPGDVLGTRQHGDLPLKVADLVRDQDLLATVRNVAFDLLGSGEFDQPAFAPLKIRVLERFGKLFDLVGSG